MKSLVIERNVARFAAARVMAAVAPGRSAGIGPLRLAEQDPPAAPAADWYPVLPSLSGICGSDLATLDGRSSRYFEDLVSFPFVPGHEIVGVAAQGAVGAGGAEIAAGARVVIEPVLGCAARGIEPPCRACATGNTGDCTRVAHGHVRPGLQTGFCTDTGGGWSEAGLVAHSSQLHPVPAGLSDEDAVTVEPVACATHAVHMAALRAGEVVAVLGAGTLGLALTAALTHLVEVGRCAEPEVVLVGARYPHQQRWALEFGATSALPADALARAVRRRSRSLALGSPRLGTQQLTGGADVVFDCVGSSESIAQSLSMVRPRGRIVLVGMPGRVHVDLAALWHREISLAGAYAYGTEGGAGGGAPARTFDLAFDVVARHRTGRLVSATYPLERFEEAITHAGQAGRRGSVKIAFAPHAERSASKGPRR
ncbi:MAG TPA: zinc-binding dehydrogenase [Acidimicrobiales bacterium]